MLEFPLPVSDRCSIRLADIIDAFPYYTDSEDKRAVIELICTLDLSSVVSEQSITASFKEYGVKYYRQLAVDSLSVFQRVGLVTTDLDGVLYDDKSVLFAVSKKVAEIGNLRVLDVIEFDYGVRMVMTYKSKGGTEIVDDGLGGYLYKVWYFGGRAGYETSNLEQAIVEVARMIVYCARAYRASYTVDRILFGFLQMEGVFVGASVPESLF